MFSFFRRNKARPNPANNAENPNKTSVNMQLAIERQQASLAQNLAKRANDVNDREQNVVDSHTSKPAEDSAINRSTALPSHVSEVSCAVAKTQNYDQFRDAKRSSSSLYDSIEKSPRQGNTPFNYPQSIAEKFSPTVAVASSIKDQQKCSPIAGTDSTNAYNSVYEAMGRGRNRNKHRGGANIHQQPHQNKNTATNVNLSLSNEISTVLNSEHEPKFCAPAHENSEKSDSISSENVFHDENLCSKNSQAENKNDNIAASDSDEAMLAATEATNLVSNATEDEVKNDECEQQVGVLLQRNPSSRRVTFAPSPPRSVASSATSDDEEETTSEDVFYEATEALNETQKLKILSTVTSHSTIDEETSEVDGMSTPSGESSTSSSNDVVCGKIILSVNENCEANDNGETVKSNAFSSDENSTSISCDTESAPKTVKPSYLLVGEDTIALPDIVAESSSLLEQHHPDDEKANLASQAGSYVAGNSIAGSQIEIVDQMQVKVNELCMKIDELERELNLKNGAVDRLQSELEATNKDGECVRQRLRFQDAQLEKLKERQDLSQDEESKKYVALEQQYKDTVERLQKMQSLASNLNVQLAQASVDVEKLRQERDEILDKLTVQEKLLRDILQTASEEREQIVAKMKHDFEQLRNVNSDREEHLMEDCEWKLRQMMKQCKEKIDKAEKEKLALKDQAQIDRQTIRSQRDEIKSLKACEVEANQLRGLTNDQKDSMTTMMKRIDDLKTELANTKRRLQDEIDSCLQIKRDCAYQLSEKERSTINRIEIARGESAMEWEDRLMEEMCRLTQELEQVHLDERNSALAKQKAEHLVEIEAVATKFKQDEQKLLDEIATLKAELEVKQQDLRDAQSKADMQLVEQRSYLDRREREHQREVDRLQMEIERHLREHSDLIDEIKGEHKREKEQIKTSFYRSLEQIKEEFANEITLTTETLQAKHKRELEEQWKQLVQEKEEALQKAENRHRIRIEDADNKLSALKLQHKRQMKDIQDEHDIQKARVDNREVSNAQEIDTLRRKCICLTKLFEEMRMRYERRDPRPEDLRQIDELKSICDSQEKDIFDLTEQLREIQLLQQQQQMQNHQNQTHNANQSKKNKNKNNKNGNNNRNNISSNGNSNNNTQEQPQQTQQNANHEQQQQQQRMKPPPLIKTIIYEEENENELYEQQIREERENAQKIQMEAELQQQQDGVTVELVPESPDYLTKHMNIEEISEAHIVSDMNNIPDVVVASTPSDKLQEIHVEVISTIEPANIQIVPNGSSTFDMELD